MPYYIKKKKSDKPKKRQTSQATLVKKLDKVFSQYIRLRDAILMARNWEHSIGCRAELNVALTCGIKIIYTMNSALLW